MHIDVERQLRTAHEPLSIVVGDDIWDLYVFGVTRVLPEPLPVTVGARILLFPGAALLWPYVLARWLKSLR